MPKKAEGGFEPFIGYKDATTVASGATRAAPTLVTDGFDVQGATGFRIIISADSSATLSGAGTVRIWLWSNSLARWVHNSSLDYTLSFTAGVWRDDVSDLVCAVGYGRAFPQVDGVTASAGNITTQGEAGVLG